MPCLARVRMGFEMEDEQYVKEVPQQELMWHHEKEKKPAESLEDPKELECRGRKYPQESNQRKRESQEESHR